MSYKRDIGIDFWINEINVTKELLYSLRTNTIYVFQLFQIFYEFYM